jgi:tetratricopeptide (TPR) repeat protein
MKKLIFILIALISVNSFAQTKYQTGMEKAFELWKANKPWEAANLFERIAQAENDNWLPPFYVAQINVFNSFDEKEKEKMVAQMDKAKNFLEDAKALTENNAEVVVLEAQLLTAWVVYDGDQYGMKYSPKIAALYQKAFEIDPENPRVVLGKAQWDIGTAKFFNQPTDGFCDDIKKAIDLFANEEPAEEFYPRGGGEYAEQVLQENCGK